MPSGCAPPAAVVLRLYRDGSRAAYVEFVGDERVETLIAYHQEAFVFFGGVPRAVLYDNMRAVVTVIQHSLAVYDALQAPAEGA